MQTRQPSLLTRDDTFLGVCEALGEDFGFNPFWLRATLAGLLLWNPLVVIGGYLAAGMVVLASRLIAPNPRPAPQVEAQAPAPTAAEHYAEPEALAA
jgi:phage shock protein C